MALERVAGHRADRRFSKQRDLTEEDSADATPSTVPPAEISADEVTQLWRRLCKPLVADHRLTFAGIDSARQASALAEGSVTVNWTEHTLAQQGLRLSGVDCVSDSLMLLSPGSSDHDHLFQSEDEADERAWSLSSFDRWSLVGTNGGYASPVLPSANRYKFQSDRNLGLIVHRYRRKTIEGTPTEWLELWIREGLLSPSDIKTPTIGPAPVYAWDQVEDTREFVRNFWCVAVVGLDDHNATEHGPTIPVFTTRFTDGTLELWVCVSSSRSPSWKWSGHNPDGGYGPKFTSLPFHRCQSPFCGKTLRAVSSLNHRPAGTSSISLSASQPPDAALFYAFPAHRALYQKATSEYPGIERHTHAAEGFAPNSIQFKVLTTEAKTFESWKVKS